MAIIRDERGRFVKGYKNRSKKKLDEKRAIELYNSGLTVKGVSKEFGYTYADPEIGALIKKEGISRRAGRLKGISPITQYGNKNPNWNGGNTMNGRYKSILMKPKQYILEHHLVWVRESDWHFIPEGFVVHHRNGDRLDNRIENLACIPRGIHSSLHNVFGTNKEVV